MAKHGISPTRKEDYPEWYQQVVRSGELAEASPVRGCMVIKPHGFAVWELMQGILDDMFKSTGHKNAYFPLFIPLSYLEQEAKPSTCFASFSKKPKAGCCFLKSSKFSNTAFVTK